MILDGLVTFLGKRAGSWKGLKHRVVARRLNRIRVGERCKECRNSEATEIAVGRGAQLISQLSPVVVPIEGPPVYGAKPAKERQKKGKKERAASEVKPEPEPETREEDNRLYLTVVIEGRPCRALFDPGATNSLIGPTLAKHFA